MTCREKAIALVKSYGGTIQAEREGHSYTVTAMAPKGYHWTEGQLHECVASQNSGPWSTAPLWQDIIDRTKAGIELCGSDCEWWA